MKVILEEVKNETKTSKAGKPYTTCGIKVNGTWHNGFGTKSTATWEAGQEVNVDLFDEEYNGKMYKKFRVLSPTDLLESRVEELEKAMKVIVRELKSLKQPGKSGAYSVAVPASLTTAELTEDLPF